MADPPVLAIDLSEKMRRLSADLRSLNNDMQVHAPSDGGVLFELREALDSARLTAWTRHELLHLELQKRDPSAFLNLLASERLRRCQQLLDAICDDIDRSVLPAAAHEVHSFYEELNVLRKRLARLIARESD